MSEEASRVVSAPGRASGEQAALAALEHPLLLVRNSFQRQAGKEGCGSSRVCPAQRRGSRERWYTWQRDQKQQQVLVAGYEEDVERLPGDRVQPAVAGAQAQQPLQLRPARMRRPPGVSVCGSCTGQ